MALLVKDVASVNASLHPGRPSISASVVANTIQNSRPKQIDCSTCCTSDRKSSSLLALESQSRLAVSLSFFPALDEYLDTDFHTRTFICASSFLRYVLLSIKPSSPCSLSIDWQPLSLTSPSLHKPLAFSTSSPIPSPANRARIDLVHHSP